MSQKRRLAQVDSRGSEEGKGPKGIVKLAGSTKRFDDHGLAREEMYT